MKSINFHSVAAVAEWLESIHECVGQNSVTPEKHPVAQEAARRLRESLANDKRPADCKPDDVPRHEIDGSPVVRYFSEANDIRVIVFAELADGRLAARRTDYGLADLTDMQLSGWVILS